MVELQRSRSQRISRNFAAKQCSGKALIKIPVTAVKGDTFHFIAEGTDDGVPALTRYQRVIVMVQ